jgi:hypothetical protein
MDPEMMQISLEEAYQEAVSALGEAIVTQRIMAKRIAAATNGDGDGDGDEEAVESAHGMA